MYIAYWLNVGHAEYDVVSQRLQSKKKIYIYILKKIEKEKEKQ